jgi:hypothetical protein
VRNGFVLPSSQAAQQAPNQLQQLVAPIALYPDAHETPF